MRPITKCLLALVLTTGSLSAAERERSPVPLEKGTKWVYEAKAEWTPVGGRLASGGELPKGQWRWTTEVLEVVDGPTARAAVVHAFPDEIAGMDPAVPDGYCVLIEASNRLYRVSTRRKREAVALAHQFATPAWKLPASAEVLLELPLTVDKRWGGDTTRADGWYCWHVEARKEEKRHIKGMPDFPSPVVFTVAFRTGPDHEIMEIVPGVGIIGFEYEHHGTVAEANVRLVEYIRGESKEKLPAKQ